MISVSTPAAGDGISASTLSVEISNNGSSRSTVSPTFFIQRTIVPSAMDSPIWGIVTSVAMFGYRNRGVFFEAATNQILDDLVAACQPRRMRVVGDFAVRGGMKTVVTANYSA